MPRPRPPFSSITVSEDEKTVTVTVVPKNDDVTTNGLFTVDYDASVLTLADVTFASQYSSHKDADGKATLGYVDVDGLQAGTAVATLTFTVSDPTAMDTSTAVTVHQTEINDQTVDVTEDLTADLHQDTKVVNASPPPAPRTATPVIRSAPPAVRSWLRARSSRLWATTTRMAPALAAAISSPASTPATTAP